MSRCRHRRSHRAAATVLPPSRCAPPPLPLPLPPPQRRRQAVTNVALSRCRHSLAAAKLPPTSRCRAAATAAAATAAAAAAAAATPLVGWLFVVVRRPISSSSQKNVSCSTPQKSQHPGFFEMCMPKCACRD
jgi:hypothetical protein